MGKKQLCLVLALLLGATACDSDRAKPASSKAKAPTWLDKVEIQIVGVEPSFEENIEVSLELVNHADQAFSIEGLGMGEVVRLLDDQGKLAPLHRVSVGLAKPIRVRPGATTKASLLFTPLPGKPAKLRVYDRTLPVP